MKNLTQKNKKFFIAKCKLIRDSLLWLQETSKKLKIKDDEFELAGVLYFDFKDGVNKKMSGAFNCRKIVAIQALTDALE